MPAVGAYGIKGYVTDSSVATDPVTLQATTSVAVFVYWQDNATVPTVSDNKGNTLTLIASGQVGPNAGGNWCGLWVGVGIVGGSNYILSATKGSGYPTIGFVEVTGADSYDASLLIDPASPYAHSITATSDAIVVGFMAPQGEDSITLDGTANGFVELAEIGSFDFWQMLIAAKVAASGSHTFAPALTSGTMLGGAGLGLVAFYGAPVAALSGALKHFDGASWARRPIKHRDGTFGARVLKRWDSTSWQNT